MSQLSEISQFSLGRIIATESLPSLITLEKICAALDVTLSQFFCEEDMKDMTETQTEVLEIWKDLSADEQEVVLAMLSKIRNSSKMIFWIVPFWCHLNNLKNENKLDLLFI